MSKNGRLKIGVLVSGGGTNLQRIIDEIAADKLDAEITVVISNNPKAHGLVRAEKAGITTVSRNSKMHERSEYDKWVREQLESYKVDLVVMAGYMILLGKEVLDAYPNKVINLHPALLPSFPGEHGIEDAFNAGVKVTGITVHFADYVYDTGPIIAQTPIRIEEEDTPETLEAKIHAEEYILLPKVIQWIAEGKVKVDGRKVKIS